MKLTILGAAGVRTPLVLKSIIECQDRLGLNELALMDVDAHRLDLIRQVCESLAGPAKAAFKIIWTTNARRAVAGADFVITTFRVGG